MFVHGQVPPSLQAIHSQPRLRKTIDYIVHLITSNRYRSVGYILLKCIPATHKPRRLPCAPTLKRHKTVVLLDPSMAPSEISPLTSFESFSFAQAPTLALLQPQDTSRHFTQYSQERLSQFKIHFPSRSQLFHHSINAVA